jgi:bacterioferritin-associated ferredoxin
VLVCHCKAVCDRTIRQCVRGGDASSVEEVGLCTGAGTRCGGCHESIEDILEEEQLTSAVLTEAPPGPGLRRLPVIRPDGDGLSEVA